MCLVLVVKHYRRMTNNYDFIKARLDANIYHLTECRKRIDQASFRDINEDMLRAILEEQIADISRGVSAMLDTLREAQ